MRYIHISARLTTIMGTNNTPQTVVVRPGTTLNFGSKQRKRIRFAAKKAAKAELRVIRRAQREQFEYDQRLDRAESAHLHACAAFDAEKIEQEAA